MIIIPARLASTRFPRKILADVCGLPMVIQTAKKAMQADEVCVACDDMQVLELCQAHKIRAVLTDTAHQSGTDRCNEAAQKLGLNAQEIIINLQADEPFIEAEILKTLRDRMRSGAWMASCARIIDSEQALDPNLVKVVLDSAMNALYFSRSVIPYDRDKAASIDKSTTSLESNPLESSLSSHNSAINSSANPPAKLSIAPPCHPYYGHLGVYGYSRESLAEFCALPQDFNASPLEHREKLEQLRALYHGKPIAMVLVETQSIGIDTPSDLERALKKFANK